MTATSISANRLRMITSQYSAPAVEAAAFDPIAPGGVDHFAYDLSADAGAAQMIETTWTCSFDAGESDAVDEDPQARIIEAWITNSIAVSPSADSEANPRPVTYYGWFSVARIGNMPPSAAGGSYRPVASTQFDDGRYCTASVSLPLKP